jgi:hypothetical protein
VNFVGGSNGAVPVAMYAQPDRGAQTEPSARCLLFRLSGGGDSRRADRPQHFSLREYAPPRHRSTQPCVCGGSVTCMSRPQPAAAASTASRSCSTRTRTPRLCTLSTLAWASLTQHVRYHPPSSFPPSANRYGAARSDLTAPSKLWTCRLRLTHTV